MTQVINAICNFVCDLIMSPVALASPWPGILAASFFLAILVLLAFRFFSNQPALRRARGQMLARLLETQLLGSNPLSIFGTFGRIVVSVLRYTKESVKPLLVLIIPMTLFLIQLTGWFGSRPLREGESFLLTVRLDRSYDVVDTPVSPSNSGGIRVETGPFLSTVDNEVAWRLRSEIEDQDEWVDVSVGDQTMRKQVTVTALTRKVSRERVRGAFWASLAHPSERPLPRSGPVLSIGISYPARDLFLGSVNVNWVVAIFVVSTLFALVLKYPLRVRF